MPIAKTHETVRRAAVALLLAAGLFWPGCRAPAGPAPAPLAPRAAFPGRTVAVLINGGGQPRINFQSHLLNVRSILDLLERAGVPRGDIAIFSADGADPKPDLATRETAPEADLWLIPRSGVGALLRPPVTIENSAIDGYTLRPATRKAIDKWFTEDAQELGPGDTLLLYVTDHGERNKSDLTDNTITLWGEKLSVAELRGLIALVDSRVRVLLFMSQCFSGSFANLILPGANDVPAASNVCGYFASTADRPAYGCYPENLGKDAVGHSFHMFEAVGDLGRLPEAERRVQVTDDSPDVPHTTADFYLAKLLEKKAAEQKVELEPFADKLIGDAWEHKKDWEPEIRLLDRVGQTFGFFSPRSLAELKKQAETLPVVSDRLRTYAQRWREAEESLALENTDRFLEENPAWRDRLTPQALKDLDATARRQRAADLLADLVPFTERNKDRHARLLLLKERNEDASKAAYRMEVRLGVVLRMRTILLDVAGREYLERHGTAAERQVYADLVACENFDLNPSAPIESAAALPAPPSFPEIAEDQSLVEKVMPAWMGIRYRPLDEAEQKKAGASRGAVAVITLYPDSPAATSGLQVGDVILGPPGHRFEEPNQVREWTMRSEVGASYPLEVQREADKFQVTLKPGPFPLEMPALPGPPKVGSVAPPLKIELVRGGKELPPHRSRLLFFWATWCMPCKASLPEVLAFARARDVDVVAITDEPAETVTKFLGNFGKPFPSIVATDRLRTTFQSYGVSGTPTFVLIDESDNVRHVQTGYNPSIGLTVEGWKFEQKKEAKN
jgi:thiol-disulfide isomerase/thioredoxin